jgi:hypothetical protein
MLTSATPVRRTAWILLFTLIACYQALAPGTIEGRGYRGEDLNAGLRLLDSFNAWFKGRPVPPISWTRHGPLPLLLDLPLIKLGKRFATPDFAVSLEPVIFTAALLTIAYLWLMKMCTPGMSLLLTLIGAFGTMLWPYAYIGLETKQSFFVFLAGYMALACGKILGWPRLVLFSLVCALAISVKSTGIIFAPAIAYLVYVQFRPDWPSQWKRPLTVLLIVAGIWAMNAVGWNLFWAPRGGGELALRLWFTHSPLQVFTNLIGIFGSPSKGLFIFAPVLLLSLYAIPLAWRTRRETVIFAALVTISIVGLLSTFLVSADELWGPRFLHVTIAPFLVILGAAYPRFLWRAHIPLLVLGALGLVVSFLGAFYYYGARGWAATATGQNTLEWFAGDNVWNEVLFDARLFGVWMKHGKDPVPWTPAHFWAWTPPPDAQPWKTVNLRDYADPQSFLLYYWGMPLTGPDLLILRICLLSVFISPLLLAWVVARTMKIAPATTVNDEPVLTLRG